MFFSNSKYMASVALDNHLKNLSGLILAEDRLQDPATGLQCQREAVDAGIIKTLDALKNKFSKLPLESLFGEKATLDTAVREKIDALKYLRRNRFESINSVKTLHKLGKRLNENITLQQNLLSKGAAEFAHKSAHNSVSFSWLHRHPERTRICKMLVELDEVSKSITTGMNAQNVLYTATELSSLEARKETLTEQLQNINNYSLTYSKDIAYSKKCDAQTLLQEMLPQAKAVLHHNKPSHINEKAALLHANTKLSLSNAKISRYLRAVKRAFGSKPTQTIRTAFKAAVLTSFINSEKDLDKFSLSDPKVMDSVSSVLTSWGLNPHEGLFQSIVPALKHEMCGPSGLLKRKVLQKDAERVKLKLSAKTEFAQHKKEIRTEKHTTRVKAWLAAKKDVFKDETMLKGRRLEGVQGLMEGLALPGASFCIDRARGVVLDTGKSFSIMGTGKATEVLNPITLRLASMKDRSIDVKNAGGGYEVLIKDATLREIGIGSNIKLPANFLVSANANAKADTVKGLVLQFSETQDCEQFLEHILNPNKKKGSATDIWQKAESVSFVKENGETHSLGVSISNTLLSKSIFDIKKFDIVAEASLAFHGTVREKTEHNAFEHVHTMEQGFSLNTGAHIGANLTSMDDKKTEAFGPQIGKPYAAGGTYGLSITQNRHGIHGAMDFSMMQGAAKSSRALTRFIPKELAVQLQSNADFAAKMERLFHESPPNTVVKLHLELSPEKHREVQQINAVARQSDPQKAKECEKTIHAILADRSAYVAKSLSFSSVTASVQPKEFQFAVGGFKVARSNSFDRSQTNILHFDDYK